MIIHIENKEYHRSDFLKHCQCEVKTTHRHDWKNAVYQFFIDWHNENESVEVQTSGSTGEAKTITLLKKHMVASAQATIRFLNTEPNEWAWLCLPANYIAGKMMIIRALTGGMNLWISKPDTHVFLPNLNNIGLTAMVPMQLASLIKDPSTFRKIEEKISHLLIGGTSIPGSLEKQLNRMSGITLWHTYGMTETISHVALRRVNGLTSTTEFNALSGVTLSQNKQGSLVIDYPTIGVKNLHTHDLVKLLSEKQFIMEGRSDWIINSGGVKINPIMVEKWLEEKLPECFIITWLPDPILGQKAILCFENDGSLLPEICSIWKKIETHYQENHLLREIHFTKTFIRSENGKIRRNATQQMLINGLTSKNIG